VRIKSEKDFWSGILFVTVGVGFAWGATAYNFGSSAQPGPGYFPLGLGLLMALLGSLVLFKSLVVESEGGDPIGRIAWRPLVVVLGAVALFGALLPVGGLVVALPALVLVSSLAGDEFRLVEVLCNAAVLTVGCWVVFVWGLGLSLPMWPAGMAG
jgi:hypothetical protein